MVGENVNQPPEDDCCPICFDSFQLPCLTNCGHWYCGSCSVSYWRHSKNMKWCNCPICGCLVKNLMPYSSQWIPQILIRAYNYQFMFRWVAFFMKMLTMLLRVRGLPPEDDENTRLACFCRTFSDIIFLISLAVQMSRYGIISHWLAEMLLVTPFRCMYLICAPLMIVIDFDDKVFRPRRRARQLAEALDLIADDD